MPALYPDRRGSNRGGTGPYAGAGVPGNGTSEVQTVTVTGTPDGGTFRLKFKGRSTADIAYGASAATVQTALRAVPTIGGSNVTVSGSDGGAWSVTFAAALGKRAQPLLELHANALTGGTAPSVTIEEATPGVDATAVGASKGAIYQDTTNGTLYVQTGTVNVPVWSLLLGVTAQTALTHLTDNSGGSANSTVEACGTAVTGVDGSGNTAASKADVDTRLTAIANNFADVAGKINALLTKLESAGIIAS